MKTHKQRRFLAIALSVAGYILIGTGGAEVERPGFAEIEKIDAHTHIRYAGSEFLDQAKEDNFRLHVIILDLYDIPMQDRFLAIQKKLRPERFRYSTTFSMKGWNRPGWQQDVIERLDKAFQDGAVSVKVWKNIGMVERDKNGDFIMIDNPRFDPILDFIEEQGKALAAHLGEPRDCWLPLDKMIAESNRRYYSGHPEYHMYLHPEYPSYEAQIAAFNHMLEKHPKLRVVGAHLASTEWSMTELAKRLEKYSNLAVDLAGRIDDLQYLHQEEVRNFFIKHKDRILYGTDLDMDESKDPEEYARQAHERWLTDWTYFATNKEVTVRGTSRKVRGLNLPVEVLERIYHGNAERWYRGF